MRNQVPGPKSVCGSTRNSVKCRFSNIAVGDAAQPPRLTLQAIWYGERPYVIAGDGTRYHEGAFTNDGWTIKEIGQTALVLTKGGATVALKYQ